MAALENISMINTLKRLEECPEEMLIVLSGMEDCECDRGQSFGTTFGSKLLTLKGYRMISRRSS